MADDDAKSAKSKFKSKWHRVFKEKEEHELTPQHTNSFKLQEDLSEFLKPSTDNAQNARPELLVPKLDISAAQRWPAPNEVKAATGGASTPNGYTKPRRREGLVVEFVRTEPEVIGEGGDECENPAVEISRRKPATQPQNMPGTIMHDAPMQVSQSRAASQPMQAAQPMTYPNGDDVGFESPPLRRVQTTGSDYSPPLERKETTGSDYTPSLGRNPSAPSDYSPPIYRKEIASRIHDQAPQIPRLSRTFTSASSESEFGFGGGLKFEAEEQPSIPKIDTTLVESQTNLAPAIAGAPSDVLSPSPRDPQSRAARKRELASNEGMMLRRASALIKNPDEDEDAQRQNLAMGVQWSSDQYDTLSHPDAPSLMPEVAPTPRSALTPASAASPSPFADPKYIKRHSGNVAAQAARPGVLSSGRSHEIDQRSDDPNTDRSPLAFSERTAHWAPVPAVQRVSSEDEQPILSQPVELPTNGALREQSPAERQNSIQTSPPQHHPPSPAQRQNSIQSSPPQQVAPPITAPQPPLVEQRRPSQPPPISIAIPPEITYKRPSQGEDLLTNMRVPSGENSPRRPSPQSGAWYSPSGTSRYFVRPGESPRSRDPSPRQLQANAESAASERSSRPYSRSNGSGTNVDIVPPAPAYTDHTRSSSRDSNSSITQQYLASGGPRTSAAYLQGYTSSPPSGSPRSSMYGKPSASGSGTNLSPVDRAQRTVPLPVPRSPLSYVEKDGYYRPGSSGSNPPTQQPGAGANSSIPRVPASQQEQGTNRYSGVYMHQADGVRSSSADSRHSRQRSRDSVALLSNAQSPIDPKERPQATPRGVSSGTMTAGQRPSISPLPTSEGNPAADVAFSDFAARVAHMKGVFKLTAERERPPDRCTALAWLRTALWWYLGGKAGLEVMARQRSRSPDVQQRELLTQPHVDLAKAWWILSDPLSVYDSAQERTQDNASPNRGHPDTIVRQSVVVLKNYMKSLCFSISRSQLLPPHQSLIQGQDTAIWLEYPRLNADTVAALGGSHLAEVSHSTLFPLDALPLGDNRETFCYGRFPVAVSLNSDDPGIDRMVIPCIFSMVRDKREFGTTVIIASQNELVNIKVGPRQGKGESLTWFDVSWKQNPAGMSIRLGRTMEMTVRMQEKDFRSLWNLLKYAEKIEDNVRPDHGEKFLHEAQLAEMQYADSTNASDFPQDKIRGARAFVFERSSYVGTANRERRVHRGFRLALVTDPRNKSLACASHDVCRKGPLYFEYITDSAANGMAAMVIRIREDGRQCRILLVFASIESRQVFSDELNGIMVGPNETIMGKMALAGMNIEPAFQARSLMQEVHPALRALQWQRLGVTNNLPPDPNARISNTVFSDSLRVVARHTTGCITDRLNLGKGELQLRFPCADVPALQILRNPQEDIGMSIDTRHSDAHTADGITQLDQMVRQQPTIRTYSFTSYDDLHAFQTAITGHSVRYDGMASTLSIARRRMVVPIYKKWEAHKVRLQVITQDTIVQVLAFMEDFTHTNALCFQVRSTDVLENNKGDNKGKKWTVRLIDAKFSLPHIPENHNEEGAPPDDAMARVRRRFVNLEGLDNPEEHDDITVGFETEFDRDRFAQALPAATKAGGLHLRRKT